MSRVDPVLSANGRAGKAASPWARGPCLATPRARAAGREYKANAPLHPTPAPRGKISIQRLQALAAKGLSAGEIATQIGRTERTIRNVCAQNGIALRVLRPKLVWTPQQMAILRKSYSTKTAQDIADMVGMPLHAVYRVAQKLGLRKSSAWMAEHARETLSEAGKGTRFGVNAPWNRGLKGITGTHKNSAKHHFKKGNRPQNYRPIGSLRVCDGILQIKLTDDRSIQPSMRWEPVTRVVWYAHHGDIPSTHVVRFKPGTATTDFDAITIDKLELITKAESMHRNNRHYTLSPKVNAMLIAKGALTRVINNQIKKGKS